MGKGGARPQSEELNRSGHVPLGEHGVEGKANQAVAADDVPGGAPVPEENRPGHRPERDQDKPVGRFRARMTGEPAAE